MKTVKVIKNSELEKVVGGSLKNALPRWLSSDGTFGTYNQDTGVGNTYRHFPGLGR